MKQNFIYFTMITLIFIVMEVTYVKFPLLFDTLDEKINSYYMMLHTKERASDKVVIVDIDAESIDKLGQWPFSRDILAQSVINLTQAGAGIIGFDMVFSNPDRLSADMMAKRLGVEGNFTNNDEIFSQVIAQTPVILGYYFDMQKKSAHISEAPLHAAKFSFDNNDSKDILSYFHQAQSVINNIDVLKKSAYSSGYFNMTDNVTGVVTTSPLLISYENQLFPSLAFEMLRIASQSDVVHININDIGVESLELDTTTIYTDAKAQVRLNYRGAQKSYRYLSFYNILTNDFNRSDVEGKFVLIGTSDIGLNDLINTIYDTAMPGVEAHATLIDNILNNDYFYTPIDVLSYGIILIFLVTIVEGILLLVLPSSLTFTVFLLSFAGLIALNYYFIFTMHIVMNFAAIFIALILTTGVFALLSYYYESVKREKIFRKFSNKVSTEVANELIANDEKILKAKKENVTIFFSDIRGFTKLSEQVHDPEKLISILNTYMEPMTQSIIEHRGTVDKFIGDAIMAYWNAPTHVENHADSAVECALEQLKLLNKVNEQLEEIFNVHIKIGIGINSGECIVGEIGSNDKKSDSGRSDYTIIGDAVNLASRVEGLTKEYGVKLIITEHTKKLLKGEYELREIDRVQVRGKSEATTLYEVIS